MRVIFSGWIRRYAVAARTSGAARQTLTARQAAVFLVTLLVVWACLAVALERLPLLWA